MNISSDLSQEVSSRVLAMALRQTRSSAEAGELPEAVQDVETMETAARSGNLHDWQGTMVNLWA